MANQAELLWECDNDYDTEIKYEKGTVKASANQGVCSGLSAEWCKNILKGVRPELSKPFLLQGMIYQRFYDWGADREERNAKIIATAGMTQRSKQDYATARLAAQGLWRSDAVFLVGLSNHMIAAAKTANTKTMLLFDPNFGCYSVVSELRLQELIDQAENAVSAAKALDTRLVDLA
jgi:hypothetical protein